MALLGGTSLGGLAGGAATTRLLVVISGDSSQLTAAMAQAEGSVSGFAKNATSIGSALTRSVSLPALALSGVMIGLASSFESSLARVAALTPILDESGRSIESVGNELLQFSKTVPTSATDMADALYFAGSAGLNAATSLSIVKRAAEGSAIGMGTAADISKVLIFALNNYKGAGLTAASAMDALTVAIREGTAEPEDLAIALGRLLPIAREAGVTFQQVVGSVAQLTNLGLGARVATTSLRALFSELLSPTQQAAETLHQFGLEAEDVRDALTTGGPIAAFQLLEDATGGNIDALHDIIPQIRGFTAYLGLSGDQAEKTAGIYNKVQNSAGALQRALSVVARTSPEFKFGVALNQLRVAAIGIGQQMLPIFLRLTSILGDFGSVVSGMPPILQSMLSGLLLIAGAAGPLIKLFGVITADGTAMFTSVKSGAAALLTLGVAAGVAVGGFQSLASGTGSIVSALSTFIGMATAAGIALGGLVRLAGSGALGLGTIADVLSSLRGIEIAGLAVGVGLIATAIGYAAGQSEKFNVAANQMGDAMSTAAAKGTVLANALKQIDDEGIAEELTQIADKLNLLQLPTAKALPDLLTKGLGGTLISDLDHLETSLGSNINPEFQRMAQVVQQAAAAGGDLGSALQKAGFSSEEFLSSLDTSGITGEQQQLATSIHETSRLYGEAGEVLRNYQNETRATILAHSLEGAAVEKLADKYGTSVPFMESTLQDFGATATGVGEDATGAFGKAAGFLDKTTNEIIGAQAEAAAAIEKHSAEISDALAEGFSPLGEQVDDTLSKSVSSVIANYRKLGDTISQESANIVELQQRGLPQGLIDQLVADGPAAVAKFVDASGNQLKELVGIYEFWLGATDDAVLAEGAHLEEKGKNNIEGFATAMLTQSNLPVQAAYKIARGVAEGVSRGDLAPAALDLTESFTKTIGAQLPSASKSATAKAVTAFVQGLQQAKGGAVQAGHLDVQAFAQGIASASGIPKQKAAAIVQSVVEGFKSGGAKARAAANDIAKGFSDGLQQSAGQEASRAGHKIVEQTFTGLQSGGNQAGAAGKKFGSQFAAGVSSGAGAAAGAGKRLGQAAVNPLNAAAGAARSAGTGVGPAMAAGINAGAGAAVAAAAALAARVKAAMNLHDSPRVFTYYKGIELGKELGIGLDKGLRHLEPRRPIISPMLGRGHVRGGGRDRGPVTHKHAHINIRVHGAGSTDRAQARMIADEVGVEIGKWM